MNGIDVSSLMLIAGKAIAIYLFVIFAFRLFGKKELAQLSVIDLVFILLISNSVQNAMVGPDNTLLGGMAAATGLFLINYLFKWLLKLSPKFSDAVQGHSVMLIYEGKVIKENLETSMLTMEELEAAIREHGVKDIQKVNLAVLEVDGNISVLSDNFKQKSLRKRKTRQPNSKKS